MSLLIGTIILLDQGPTLMTSFSLNYFLVPNIATLKVRPKRMSFEGHIHSVHGILHPILLLFEFS